MNINCKKKQTETIMTLAGELNIYTAGEFKTQLFTHLGHPGDVEVELSQVSEVDSAGVQIFILANREAAQRGCHLRLAGHSHAILDVFELYNLASYFGDPLLMSTTATHSSDEMSANRSTN